MARMPFGRPRPRRRPGGGTLIAGISISVSPSALYVGGAFTITVTVPAGGTLSTVTATDGGTPIALTGSGNTRTGTAPAEAGPLVVTATGADADGNPLTANRTVQVREEPVAPTAPGQFSTSDWSVTTGLAASQVVLNVSALPSDGGSTITALQYTVDGGSTWTALTGAGTGSRTLTMPAAGTSYTFALRAVNAVGPGAASATKSATSGAEDAEVTPLTMSRTSLNRGDNVTVTTATAVDSLTATVNGAAQAVTGSGRNWTISNLAPGGLTITAKKGTEEVKAKALVGNTGATSRDLNEPWCYFGASMTNNLDFNIPRAISLAGGDGTNFTYMFRSASGLREIWDNDGIDTTGTAPAGPGGAPSLKTALAVGDRKVLITGDKSGGYYDFDTVEAMYQWDELATRNGVTDRYFYMIHYSTMPTNTEIASIGSVSGAQDTFRAFWVDNARKNLRKKEEWLAHYNANRVPGTKPLWVIPVLPMYLAIYDAIEAGTAPAEITSMGQFFLRSSPNDGHMKDLGLYLITLAHYATVWRRKPTGMRFTDFYSNSTTGSVGEETSAWLVDLVWDIITARTDTGLTDTWTYPAIAAATPAAQTIRVGVSTPGSVEVRTSNGLAASALSMPDAITGVPAGSVTVGTDNASAVTDALNVLGLGTGANKLRAFRVDESVNAAYTFAFPPETVVGDRVVLVAVTAANSTAPFYNAASQAEAEVARKTFWGSSQVNMAVRSGLTPSGGNDRRSFTMVQVTATEDNIGKTIATNTLSGLLVTVVVKGDATVSFVSASQAQDGTDPEASYASMTVPAAPDAQSGSLVLTMVGGGVGRGYTFASSNLRMQWWSKPERMVTTPNSQDLTAVQISGQLFQMGFEYPDGPLGAETIDAVGRKVWSSNIVRLVINPLA
ncbi:fibronectin type III domain-containing protein [Paenirhodobacter populi]|uniref:Fibronectin type III domain-containing protein n=1 Tax=Paenirhodobacter populi TaxID=2306993 RepID=A0A443JE67_9RHOB|nr:fibronectin type III domain-containing protein [Sinirhodobacter populi]RWR18784.1 fibronectin type III domain-containing protein [Sinirhodobacter populi]